jgi:predicted flavoprotein YhiN
MTDYTNEELVSLLRKSIPLFPNLPAGELLTGLLNKRVGQEIIKQTLPKFTGKQATVLEPFQLEAIADTIKDFRFPITGTMPWQSAQVTAGGVPLSEVELASMQSRKCSHLYLAGELLNIDGDCGGYNLHWAWCSGIIAGRSAALD